MKSMCIQQLKNLALIGLFLLFGVCGYSQKSIKVNTVDAFIDALGSNTTIELQEGDYDLSKINTEKKKRHVKIKTTENETIKEVVISGVSNLKIIGKGKLQSKVFSNNPTITLLNFNNCNNIVINNVELGYKVTKQDCDAKVIDISDCDNFSVINCLLYGSCSMGINAVNVKQLSLLKTTVKECSFRIFNTDNCSNTKIDSCLFAKNKGGVIIVGCDGFNISNTEFSDNINETIKFEEKEYYTYLIDVSSSKKVHFTKSKIINNNTSYLIQNSQLITLDDVTEIKDNKFIRNYEK